jgi:peptidoglycan/xylan/chitin deacetylase (PgdA/CDA1 family)
MQILGRFCELKRDTPGGLPRLCKAAHPKFAVLCYHRIGTGGIPLFSELPAELFEAQMRYIRHRFRVFSLDELCAEMQRPTRRSDAVAVTFDDGYRDLYAHALPALKKYNIPATIFLPVASIETGEVPWYDRIFLALRVFPQEQLGITLGARRIFRLDSLQARLEAAAAIIGYLRTIPDERRKEYCRGLEERFVLPADQLKNRMLTWEQIREMSREGITFGSHTMTHPAVSQLTAEQLERELGDSKRILEQRIGCAAPHFAYPFGKPEDCGAAALPVLQSHGYGSAATTLEGVNQPGDSRYELRRTQIVNERSLSMFIFKLNSLFWVGAENSAVPRPRRSANDSASHPESLGHPEEQLPAVKSA